MAQTGQQRGARKKVTWHSHSRARRTRGESQNHSAELDCYR